MADSKLSALTALAVEPDATDQLYVNDGGVSKRIAYSVLEAAICDTTNVTAAGALMDSEVTNLAAVKAFDPADYATAAQGTTADSALQDVVSDTTPQLGGSLDVNGNKIVSASNGNIDIEPNGTGNVLLGNFTFDADQTVGAGQDNYVLTYDNGTGLISLEAAAGGGSGDFLADGTVDMTGQFKTDVGTFASDVADGASAVGFLFNTTNAYSTSGAKIASFRNNGTERFKIEALGQVTLDVGAVSSNAAVFTINTPTASPAFSIDKEGDVTIATGGSVAIGAVGSAVSVGTNPSNGNSHFEVGGLYGGRNNATFAVTFRAKNADSAPGVLNLTGAAAFPTATTNIVGGAINVTGGAGASSSAGNAHGGNVVLTGGTGYGTGHKGYIVLDLSSLPTSDPSVNGALWLNTGVLTVSGA